MKEEKAYKLLSVQEGISNKKAKELIDEGVVCVKGERVLIARAMMDVKTRFTLTKIEKVRLIYEDPDVLVLDKPAYQTSESLAKIFTFPLLHRLDKETSGVLVLAKNEDFRLRAIEEFKHMRVEKIYYALVHGKFAETQSINESILTTKSPYGVFSKVSHKGKEAFSQIEPVMIEGGKSLVKVSIKTGRTHQIRVHLAYISHPILGDLKYGKHKAPRLMLHSYKMKLFDKVFEVKLPSIFQKYGFNIT